MHVQKKRIFIFFYKWKTKQQKTKWNFNKKKKKNTKQKITVWGFFVNNLIKNKLKKNLEELNSRRIQNKKK